MFVMHPSKHARDHVVGLNFRGWFGVSFLYCTLKSRLETTFRVSIHLRRLPSQFRSRGKWRSLAEKVLSAIIPPKTNSQVSVGSGLCQLDVRKRTWPASVAPTQDQWPSSLPHECQPVLLDPHLWRPNKLLSSSDLHKPWTHPLERPTYAPTPGQLKSAKNFERNHESYLTYLFAPWLLCGS